MKKSISSILILALTLVNMPLQATGNQTTSYRIQVETKTVESDGTIKYESIQTGTTNVGPSSQVVDTDKPALTSTTAIKLPAGSYRVTVEGTFANQGGDFQSEADYKVVAQSVDLDIGTNDEEEATLSIAGAGRTGIAVLLIIPLIIMGALSVVESNRTPRTDTGRMGES
ncbi:MAG: hypothetical protein S4CHLAM81_11070 [Chlamydiales bacterium]|nr:hypothetical protein [Chlamydiales bacterium]MCH9635885.1 hypothetical protein [Chlamydiales bacterium]MCH9703331.1 hypothetical protein [Chlamydiota bacterium]